VGSLTYTNYRSTLKLCGIQRLQAGCLRSQPVHDRIANAALWHSTRAGGTPAVPVKRALLKSNGHRPLTTDY